MLGRCCPHWVFRALHNDDQQCCIINQCTFSRAVPDVPFTGGVFTFTVSRLDLCMLQYIWTLHASHRTACNRMRSWAPCIPFQDNLESNSGLNFNADSETHHALSVIDYVALDSFSNFKHAKRVLSRFAYLDGLCVSVFDSLQCPIVCVCIERVTEGLLRSHRTLRSNVFKTRYKVEPFLTWRAVLKTQRNVRRMRTRNNK